MRTDRFLSLAALLLATAGCDRNPPQPQAPSSTSTAPVAQPNAPRDAAPSEKPPSPATDSSAEVVAPPANAAGLAQSANAFGFELFRKVRDKKGNLALSPTSISIALAMTYGGAKGETESEMKRVLHFGGTRAEVMKGSGQLAQALQSPNRPITVRIANRLFGEKSYRFEAAYLDATKQAFGAPLEGVDFKSDPEAARTRVNGWVEDQTQKRIRDLVPKRAIDAETRLVLVNALYFLGDWSEPFDKDATQPAPFHLTKAESRNVPTMRNTESFRFVQKDGLKALELPYKGDSMSMLFVLPDSVDGLDALETSLDAPKLDGVVSALTHQRVAVALPKFEVNPPDSLSLGDALKALGMKTAFDSEKADFTGIANPPDKADRLFIDKVFHKAFVRVDEKGTEAAAATAVVMPRAGGMPAKPVEFTADHPFLFFLRDVATGAILFMGRVADPTAQ